MATQEFYTWAAKGRPFSLARPVSVLFSWANAANVRVLGTIGNEDHLTANFPQDHTPYAYSAWPWSLPGYVVCAIDLADGSHSDQLLADARAGRAPWIKYLNFRGQQYNVKNGWSPTPNSDSHLHVSVRTDHLSTTPAFNPFTNSTTGVIDMDPNGQDIIAGVANKQVFADIWYWVVSDRHPDKYSVDTGRFHFPVPARAVEARDDALKAKVVSMEGKLDQALTILTGMGTGPGGAVTADEVRTIVDEELDEAFQGGADADAPPAP